ncbi:hypothetical protein GGX14DRAFT_485626 [Mycena pura]|uniref:HMG box domain-containing protein n=1 Tax=Mycena pura TaxID=153505 RepID=A0AAD6UJZ4_9AGAR|nr:hypothetical protein GGX14DRAFT_485626 [Mycena pura]
MEPGQTLSAGGVDSLGDSEQSLATFLPERPRQRSRHGRKLPDGHIPRPPNAFILFRSSFIRSRRVSSEVETSHSTLSKIIGLTWKNLSAEERRGWHARARAASEEHRRRFPQYAFRPIHRRAEKDGHGRRRTRESGAVDDPERCAKIAELLGEGSHGRALEAAMAEYDAQREPRAIETRFDTPITATTYRRALSAPAQDTEPPEDNRSVVAAAQRWRSSSSGPQRRAGAAGAQGMIHPLATDMAVNQLQDSTPSGNSSPWPLEIETCDIDFSGFSFASASASPTTPPALDILYDPRWTLPTSDMPSVFPEVSLDACALAQLDLDLGALPNGNIAADPTSYQVQVQMGPEYYPDCDLHWPSYAHADQLSTGTPELAGHGFGASAYGYGERLGDTCASAAALPLDEPRMAMPLPRRPMVSTRSALNDLCRL